MKTALFSLSFVWFLSFVTHAEEKRETTSTDCFTVFGEVARQGKYEIPSGTELHISQVIEKAGGFTDKAKTSKVKVVRKVEGKGNVTIFVNVHKILVEKHAELDLPIHPGDVIIVDEKVDPLQPGEGSKKEPARK